MINHYSLVVSRVTYIQYYIVLFPSKKKEYFRFSSFQNSNEYFQSVFCLKKIFVSGQEKYPVLPFIVFSFGSRLSPGMNNYLTIKSVRKNGKNEGHHFNKHFFL